MLLSHKYKFIFIKTKKTAGTSVEIELSKLMSEQDIVTPIKPNHPEHFPRNFIHNGKRLFNHIMIADLMKIFPETIFRDYYKFCIEREPVDKCVSDYFMHKNSPYHNKTKKELTWDEYINFRNFPIDTDKYTDKDNKLCVNKIIRYENLEEELTKISKKLDFPFNGINVRAKSGFRENLFVSNKDREIIYEEFYYSNKFTGYSI